MGLVALQKYIWGVIFLHNRKFNLDKNKPGMARFLYRFLVSMSHKKIQTGKYANQMLVVDAIDGASAWPKLIFSRSVRANDLHIYSSIEGGGIFFIISYSWWELSVVGNE